MENKALEGVKVVDLSRLIAGPYCTMLLADMGADVIKIESRPVGDDSRIYGPFINGESSYFMCLNRNKRSMTLNLKTEAGKGILWELIERADILVENFRPGVIDRLGFGYETVRARNPRIVYASVSGFGQTGPYRERAGYDIIGQAMGGIMAITGEPDGRPMKMNAFISDMLGALNVSIGILAAYARAARSGLGQRIDVALVDCVIGALTIKNHIYFATGKTAARMGNGEDFSAPYGAYRCADGSMVIGCSNDKLYGKLCETMGRPELQTDERFNTNRKRIENNPLLIEMIEAWLSDKTVTDAVAAVAGAGIPCAPICGADGLSEDPHFTEARNMFPSCEHPVAGHIRLTGNQIKLSDTPAEIRLPPPLLGEHTREILTDYLCHTAAQADAWIEEGVC